MPSDGSNTRPAVTLVGLGEVPVLGSAAGAWRVSILDDTTDFLEQLNGGALDVVVFDDDVDDAETIVETAHARGAVAILVTEAEPQDALDRVNELGAAAFVTAPLDAAQLTRVVTQELRSAPARTSSEPFERDLPRMVGRSELAKRACEQIAYVAPSNAPVLISGESGTGKELAAKAIHRLSPRRTEPMVTVNCGAIPPDLIESELFGHERGAFTGAEARRAGCFEVADGGTLFLDEIGELQPMVQVKLLRALQDGRFTRVGGTEPIVCDVRIIAATNRNLSTDVVAGKFRDDLYYRLNVLNIDLPPLRERPGDIVILWDHFIDSAAQEEGTDAPEVTDEVKSLLQRHYWPGNIRELQNVARRVVAMRPARTVTPRALPAQVRANPPPDDVRVPGMTLEELERYAIKKTYEATGSVRRTADILDVSERKIFYRLKQYREEDSEAADDDRPVLALVEDDPDFRAALSELLGRSYRVVEYESVADVLAAVERDQPAVIVSDVRLPERDGTELLDEAAKQSLGIPIILMSAFATDDLRREAEEKGAVAFLEKPVDTIRLGRVLERATREELREKADTPAR